MGPDYAFLVSNARKLILLPLLFGGISLLQAKWTLPVHLVALGLTALCAYALGRAALRMGWFLIALNVSYVAPLASLSVLVVALALEKGDIGPFSATQLQILAVLLVAFSAVSAVVFSRIWNTRRQLFEAHASGGRLSFETTLSLMTGPSGLSFWRSGLGPSLMVFIAVLASITGHQFGMGVKAIVACILLYITWAMLIGVVLGQCFTVLRHPRFASIPLYKEER